MSRWGSNRQVELRGRGQNKGKEGVGKSERHGGSGANTQTHILFDLDIPLVGINPTDQLALVQNDHVQNAMHSNIIQGSKGPE